MLANLGNTNKNTCKNYGYRQLNNNGDKVQITSGNNGNNYGNNERCYWAFYAPGAKQLQFKMDKEYKVRHLKPL